MTLEKKLSELREHSKEKFPAETKEKFARATSALRESGILDRALNVGDKMPLFSLKNTTGETINSNDLLKNGNLVVTFYRGVW